MGMYVDDRGQGEAAILLLHGFGATGAVWRRTAAELVDGWTGRVVVCDLPGHGRSSALPAYTYPQIAAAVAEVTPSSESLVVVGHSFGGVIATMLSSGRYGVQPVAAVAAGVKVTWSAEEIAVFARMATKPVRWFATREEAEERYRREAGLTVDVTDDPDDLERGVSQAGHQFRLSHDPASFAVGPPDMAAALADARCAVLLCRGADDHMVTEVELRAFGVPTLDIPHAGHNVHVVQPGRFAGTVVDFVAGV